MPTLGTHTTDEYADRLRKIAAESPEKKVGPWIGEAIRQRLEREGFLSDEPRNEKSAKISISLPNVLLAAMDAHESNRSQYVQRLVASDLEAAGKLPGSPIEQVTAEARAAVELIGFEKVISALRQLGSCALASAGQVEGSK